MSHLFSMLRREPVRLYLYGIATATVALLVVMGVLSAMLAPWILALVTALLAVPVTETLRDQVTPYPLKPEIKAEVKHE